MAAASRCSRCASWLSPRYPGVTGTPAAIISALAASFSPIARIAAGGAPTQTSPACLTASAKAAFSDRKP